MKITAAKLIICSPDRNFVTLRIDTDEGIYGLGDATLNGRELAVASYLQDHVLPCLIGRDPFQTEDIWQYLYRGAYWRRGPITMSAIAAVDVALWDIKGKALNTPVYNLLGGQSRQGCLVYTHANGADIAEALDSVRKHMDEGYLAVRAQAGVPGVASSYGVPKAGKPYEPAERGLPSESLLVHRALPQLRPEALRETPRGTRSGRPSPPRRPPPPHSHRSRAPRQSSRALPPLLDGRPLPRRTARKF